MKGTPEERRNAWNLTRYMLDLPGGANSISAEDCGPYAEDLRIVTTAAEQGTPKDARRVLEELDGLRNLLNEYDPETDGVKPLADLDGINAADLLDLDLPPLEYLVEGVIPEGTSLLAAAPKVGKSLLCLNIALAVATGGKALGKADVQQGRVLYIDLDGNIRGMQRRLKAMLRDEDAQTTREALSRLDIYHEFPRVEPNNDTDARSRIREYLAAYPDTRLLVVDTLADVRPKTSGHRNMYETDREALTPFRSLCAEHGVSSIFVHHTNKSTSGDPMEHVSGSTGLPSAVDNVLVMTKERGAHDAELQVMPRHEEDATHALEFDAHVATWTVKGNAEAFAKTEVRQIVLDALRAVYEGDPVGPKDVAGACEDVSYDVVRKRLGNLVEEGKAQKKGYGKYIPVPPSHLSHPSHLSQPSHPSHSAQRAEDAPF
jgi:hypothetical protein